MPSHHPVPRWLAAVLGIALMALALLLCLQWPLRDWVQAHNRTANDWGQILFSGFMALAISVATWRGTHLTAHSSAPSTSKPTSSRRRAALLLACVLPWAALLLWTSLKPMSHAMVNLERFPESASAGYWLIHGAVTVLALLACVTCLRIFAQSFKAAP